MFIAPKLMPDLLEADRLLQEGDTLYSQGDFYPAIDAYNKALEAYKKSVDFDGEAKTFLRIAKVYQSFSEWATYQTEKLKFDKPAKKSGPDNDPDDVPHQVTLPPPPHPKSLSR